MSWRRTRRINSNQAFIDMLYNKLIQFFVLFILAFLLINPIAKEADIESKAEIIITINWDEGDHDIDLWCRNPAGNVVWYREQNVGFMMLDRDDLGFRNDYITVNGKTIKVELNQEIITVRKLLQGEYTCNVFFYGTDRERSVGKELKKPIGVNVNIKKLNPHVSIIYEADILLTHVGQEKTLASWTINQHLKAVDVNTLDIPIATPMMKKEFR